MEISFDPEDDEDVRRVLTEHLDLEIIEGNKVSDRGRLSVSSVFDGGERPVLAVLDRDTGEKTESGDKKRKEY